MRRPAKVTLRRRSDGEIGHALHAGNGRGEARNEHAAGCAFEDGLEGRDHGFFSRGEPLVLDVGAVGQQGEDTSTAPGGEALHVRAFGFGGPWRRS